MSCIVGWNKRLELLTPSATNLCATNCANSTTAFLVYRFLTKKSIVFCKKLNNVNQKSTYFACCKNLIYFIFDKLIFYDIISLLRKIVRVVECACLENRCGAIHHRFKSCIFRQGYTFGVVFLLLFKIIFLKIYIVKFYRLQVTFLLPQYI